VEVYNQERRTPDAEARLPFGNAASGGAAFDLIHRLLTEFYLVRSITAVMAKSRGAAPGLRDHFAAARDSIAAILEIVGDGKEQE